MLLAQGPQLVFYLLNYFPYAEEWGRKSWGVQVRMDLESMQA